MPFLQPNQQHQSTEGILLMLVIEYFFKFHNKQLNVMYIYQAILDRLFLIFAAFGTFISMVIHCICIFCIYLVSSMAFCDPCIQLSILICTQVMVAFSALMHPACKKLSGDMVVCLGWGAVLAQLMPLPLTFSCFSKIEIGFIFLVPAHPGSPKKGH